MTMASTGRATIASLSSNPSFLFFPSCPPTPQSWTERTYFPSPLSQHFSLSLPTNQQRHIRNSLPPPLYYTGPFNFILFFCFSSQSRPFFALPHIPHQCVTTGRVNCFLVLYSTVNIYVTISG